MYRVLFSAPQEAEGRSRLAAFFRFILVIPWAIVLAFYGLAATFLALIAWFAIVFTGRYPEGLYNFNAGFVRFHGRVMGWYYLLTDEWPPFNGQPDPSYPVRLQIAPPKDSYSRLKTFFRLIYGIPVIILVYIMQILSQLLWIVSWVWMVISATHPEGLYRPLRSAIAYQVKAYAFWLLLTEDYPPFWTEEADELPGFTDSAPPAQAGLQT